jgi:alpha-beta hydrolase superfamily lysophospholipase
MWLTKRGVESLIIDQPGTGEATRLCGLATRFDSDHWARVVMDWLEPGSDIVARQIGMEGGP